MRRALLLLALALLPGCESLLGIDSGDGEPTGFVVYTSASSGNVELWAVPDNGGTPVRLTEGLGIDSVSGLEFPDVSPDGARVAVAALRDAAGEPSVDRHLWLVDMDGANPRHVVQTNPGTGFFGMSWYQDSKRLLYSDDETCSSNIVRVDVDRPGSEEVMYNVDAIAAEPRINPTDEDDILFFDQMCGESGTRRRLKLFTGEVSSIPGVADQDARSRQAQWSHDGARFTYVGAGDAISLHDLAGVTTELATREPESVYAHPVFGHGDERLFAKWCSSDGACDIVSIELATGIQTLLGVPNILPDQRTNTHVGWGPYVRDIDSNDDGLADGLTPL